MFYPTIDANQNTREITTQFLGYNHNPVISAGEWYDMKNLTSDHYPLMAARKKRPLALKMEDHVFEDQGTEITSRFYGDVGEAYAIYQSEEIAITERKTLRVSFSIDPAVISQLEVKIRYRDAEKKEISVETYEGKNTDTDFEFEELTPEKTVSMEFSITAYPADIKKFEEEKLDTYVTKIRFFVRNETIRGLLVKDGKLAYMIGTVLYYDAQPYELEEYMSKSDDRKSRQQLISYGAYILIFPAGLYFNTQDTKDHGYLGAEYIAGEHESKITYSLCDREGKAVDAAESAEAPKEPKGGDYWLDTGSTQPGLYQWTDYLDMWVAVATTYIKISMEFTDEPEHPFPKMFQEGDAVHMNTMLPDINEGSIIQSLGTITGDEEKVTGGYIIVTGIITGKQEQDADGVRFQRKIPELDFVCVSNNRVWGCKAGIVDGENINEIHASKLGDPKNWYCYEGVSTDSYTLSMGDDGEFTGAITFQGYPMFFKENSVYRIYGAYPAAYQLYTYECRGVQKGSENSLAVCGEYLMYKSVADVCVFDGSSPTSISSNLGQEVYDQAAAGSAMNKYYISMRNVRTGEYAMFVYDMARGIWMKEDDLHVTQFAYNNSGQLYGQTGLEIYGFGRAADHLGLERQETERTVEWEAVSGEYGYETVDRKYLNRITIRAELEIRAEIEISISVDDREWEVIKTIRGDSRIRTQTVQFRPDRCDHYRLRFAGHGEAKIYSIARSYMTGSEEE